jgi:hypothetical protein
MNVQSLAVTAPVHGTQAIFDIVDAEIAYVCLRIGEHGDTVKGGGGPKRLHLSLNTCMCITYQVATPLCVRSRMSPLSPLVD